MTELRLRDPKPTIVAANDPAHGLSRKQARRQIRRPFGREELHPDSVISDRTLESIERGDLLFAWQLKAQTTVEYSKAPARRRRQRLARRSRKLNRKR